MTLSGSVSKTSKSARAIAAQTSIMARYTNPLPRKTVAKKTVLPNPQVVSDRSNEPQEGDTSKRCQPQNKRKSLRVFDELGRRSKGIGRNQLDKHIDQNQ